MDEILKKCPICQEEKLLIYFHKNTTRKGGYQHQCKNCRSNFSKSSLGKKCDRTYRTKNKEKILFSKAHQRAKNNNLEFLITISDIIIPSICPVLGIPIFKDTIGVTDNSPSIDRIDNSKGYVKGNICAISFRANKLKNDGTIEEHQKVIDYMLSHKKLSKDAFKDTDTN